MVNKFKNVNDVANYLKNGGRLSEPTNLPEFYRDYLLRVMTTFVESELASSAGYVELLNQAPGIIQRINAARIIVEKAENCEKIVAIMNSFGIDTSCYGNGQNMNSSIKWADRVARDGDISAVMGKDLRISVFHYPVLNWFDGIMLSVLIGKASQIQLKDLAQISYTPLAEIFDTTCAIEQRHTNLARVELLNLAKKAYKNGNGEEVEASFQYWLPKVQAIFSNRNLEHQEKAKNLGLLQHNSTVMLAEFNERTKKLHDTLQLISQLK